MNTRNADVSKRLDEHGLRPGGGAGLHKSRSHAAALPHGLLTIMSGGTGGAVPELGGGQPHASTSGLSRLWDKRNRANTARTMRTSQRYERII